MQQRSTNLDTLRVLAAFAVVWLHVATAVDTHEPNIHSLSWWTGSLANALSRWSVPVFVMVSGALMLAQPAELSPLEFYRRKALRLCAPLVFWTVFYFVFGAITDGPMSMADMLKSVLNGSPYFHLWYLYMLIGLYLVTPFLRVVVLHGNRSTIRLLIVISFVIASAEAMAAALYHHETLIFITRFLPFIAYFVAGHYLFNSDRRPPLYVLWLLIIGAALLLAIGHGLLLPVLGSRARELASAYLNPLVIVMALAVFTLGVRQPLTSSRITAWINTIAPLTLGIYLIHPFWLRIFSDARLNGFLLHPLFGIPLTTAVVFIVSALSTAGLLRLPMLRNTVR